MITKKDKDFKTEGLCIEMSIKAKSGGEIMLEEIRLYVHTSRESTRTDEFRSKSRVYLGVCLELSI